MEEGDEYYDDGEEDDAESDEDLDYEDDGKPFDSTDLSEKISCRGSVGDCETADGYAWMPCSTKCTPGCLLGDALLYYSLKCRNRFCSFS